MKKQKKNTREIRIGSVARKIILLLLAGAALALTRRPDQFFKVMRTAKKEWDAINKKSLHEAIRRLYRSRLIEYQEQKNGIVRMVLAEEGKRRALIYNLDSLGIKKQQKWDGLWRVVLFDIPEEKKKARDALALRLKHIGMLPLQKSVFVSPYPCQDEVDFVIELFDVRPHVRFLVVKEIDVALHLRTKFSLP